jgi:hypothetical protein
MLTPTVLEKITNALVAGLPAEMVHSFAGIAKQTYSDWLRRGGQAIEKELAGEDVPETEEPYMELSREVEKAVSILALRCLKTVNQSAQGIRNDDGTFALAPSWQAAMTLLERRLPDHFGRKDRIEHAGDPNNPVVISTLAEFVLDAAKKKPKTNKPLPSGGRPPK